MRVFQSADSSGEVSNEAGIGQGESGVSVEQRIILIRFINATAKLQRTRENVITRRQHLAFNIKIHGIRKVVVSLGRCSLLALVWKVGK